MTVAIIRRLHAGGAVFELPHMLPHWFSDWRTAVAEADIRGMEYQLLGPQATPSVSVLAPTSSP